MIGRLLHALFFTLFFSIWGSIFDVHLFDITNEEVLSLQPMTPLKRFDISPPDWRMLKMCRCVQIFL